MALSNNYSKFGTRMSLSERFALIRKEAQKRAISVNPVVDQAPPPQAANRTMKNFNGTVSRADRPSAILQQGSERNKRLVLNMAMAPAVMSELNPNYSAAYNPQILAQLPHLSQTPQLMRAPQLRTQMQLRNQPPIRNQLQQRTQMQLRNQMPLRNRLINASVQKLQPQQQNIRQRLGNGQLQNGIKSRLGVKRIPINQRIGTRPVQADLQNNRNINNKLRPRNTVAFKKKQVPAAKFNQAKPINKFAKAPVNGRQPTRQPAQPARKPVTAEQLDQDLDVYMQNTKGYLNAQLDAYMSQI